MRQKQKNMASRIIGWLLAVLVFVYAAVPNICFCICSECICVCPVTENQQSGESVQKSCGCCSESDQEPCEPAESAPVKTCSDDCCTVILSGPQFPVNVRPVHSPSMMDCLKLFMEIPYLTVFSLCETVSSKAFFEFGDDVFSPALPVRLHLLHAVLLI